LSAITLLLFVGATGKSAQIPLYVWLPDAMEGPTPVSALIHAATMVTAGVYMVVRSNALYSRTPEVLLIVAAVGIATALLSAAIAVVQTDIKRVLAYSTVSQLGYMFVAAGVGAFSASIFHLTTHAFFKALLFLGSGSVILALHHEQDLFRMGGLRRCLPTTCLTMWLATCAISGVPLFSGFFSKDEILWKTLSSPLGHWSLWLAGVFVAGMTACYMFRLMLLAFHGEPSGHSDSAHTHTPHEPSKLVTFPLIVLAFLSVAGGLLGLPGYLGANVLEHFLEPVFRHASLPPAPVHESHGLELAATLAAILAGVAGMWAAYRAYVRDRDWPRRLACRFAGLYSAASRKFMVDEAYDRVLIHPVRDLSANLLWRRIDVGAVDYLVNGAGATAQRWGGFLRRMQSGYIREYAAWILTGLVLICLYLYFAYV
jgi:NADH-quinone oxidoreductase subunit L